jgi:diguanylate cyclase (GGDEF)-like protein
MLIVLVGVLDKATGSEISFSIFYLAPVSIAAWYLSTDLALLASIIAATAWFLVDSSDHMYQHPAVPIWNAGVRLGFFIITVLLSTRIRSLIDLQSSLAKIDGLTGIMNARTFKEECASAIEQARRHGHIVAIGYIDLDGFKEINDTHGHNVGDEVLKTVADAMSDRLRTSDIGARLGGDEFAILLPETNISGARALFTELHATLLNVTRSKEWRIGFSIGVAVYLSPPESSDTAIRQADELMYKVKRAGKNSISVAEFGMPRVTPTT